jgi:hypothetical protein
MIQEIVLLIISKRKIEETHSIFFYSRDTAGEEDHSTYNLRVLKKPIYTLSDGSIISNNVVRSGMNNQDKYKFE